MKEDSLFDRHVKQVSQSEDKTNYKKLYSQYLNMCNIVLLGDPGSGKSYLFKEFCEHEDGKCFTARDFTIYATNECYQRVVYIDALDEHRSQVESVNIIAEIIRKLIEIKPSKVRISCRTADWLGETDLALFGPYFQLTGDVAVLALEKLTDSEITQILNIKVGVNTSVFLRQAKLKGVYSLLNNPQTLLMLAEIVKEGMWPDSKKDLFEKATRLMVVEKNHTHSQLTKSSYSQADLLKKAGAICAHLLIANAQGICNNINSANEEFPFYGDLFEGKDSASELVLACRLFTSIDGDYLQYAHRTIAEYLGALWLKDRLDNDLPLNRLLCMMGYDGFPTTELKGLFVWLATLAQDYMGPMIQKEPLGTLMYGDVANMSIEFQQTLLNALENLSRQDPKFKQNVISSYEYFGLPSNDTLVSDYARILNSDNRSFDLRLLILKSIANGPSFPILEDVLFGVFLDSDAEDMERYMAFVAIKNTFVASIPQLLRVYREKLSFDETSITVRQYILESHYEMGFNPTDVTCFLRDFFRLTDGDLWGVADSFPVNELPAILDGLSDLSFSHYHSFDGRWEVANVYISMLARYLSYKEPITASLYEWLKGFRKLKPYGYKLDCDKGDIVRGSILKSPAIIYELFDIEVARYKENNVAVLFGEFQKLILFILDEQLFFSKVCKKCICGEYGTKLEPIIFELCLFILFKYKLDCYIEFDALMDYASDKFELSHIVGKWNYTVLDDSCLLEIKQKTDAVSIHKHESTVRELEFATNAQLIETGVHHEWIKRIVRVYFNIDLSKRSKMDSPEARLEEFVGRDNVVVCIDGIVNFFKANIFATVDEIIESYVRGHHIETCYILLAALDIMWERDPRVASYSSALIAKAIISDCLCQIVESKNGIYGQRKSSWLGSFIEAKSDMAISIYKQLAHAEFKNKTARKYGVERLCKICNESLKAHRDILGLLEIFPFMEEEQLLMVLTTVVSMPEHRSEVYKLALSVLSREREITDERLKCWICIAFLLNPQQGFDKLKAEFQIDKNTIWPLIQLTYRISKYLDSLTNNIETIAQTIMLVGEKWPHVSLPDSSWMGNQHPWDASEFVKRLIHTLSTKNDDKTTKQLGQLLKEKSLSSYQDDIRHALANQVKLVRESKYTKLNWTQTVEALRGGAPANINDLSSVLMAFLEDIQSEINCENTDKYKGFYNEDRYGRPTTPKIENSCRNYLVDLLRYKFKSLGVSVEPEGHMVHEKRADIVLSIGSNIKLPIECKREQHSNIWTAIDEQLVPLYTTSPSAKGYGVYLVFWFGLNEIKKPPINISKPRTPVELKAAIQETSIGVETVKIFVLDVSKKLH